MAWHERLKDSSADATTLTHALKVLATHGWQKTDDASFGLDAVQALAERFTVPLQEAKVNCALLQQEWEDMVYYAKQYINIVQDPYKVVWWKLFNGSYSFIAKRINRYTVGRACALIRVFIAILVAQRMRSRIKICACHG